MNQVSINQGCTASEPYALRVIGDSMVPEFNHGNIIIVDPAYPPCNGAFVVVDLGGEVVLGQFHAENDRTWLKYLNSDHTDLELKPPFDVKGVVIQRSSGRKKSIKHYDYNV